MRNRQPQLRFWSSLDGEEIKGPYHGFIVAFLLLCIYRKFVYRPNLHARLNKRLDHSTIVQLVHRIEGKYFQISQEKQFM